MASPRHSPNGERTMNYPDCQYSHVAWIRKDSATFKALSAGLSKKETAPAAATAFLTALNSAHQDFKNKLEPGANLTALLGAYQDKTGIISTREYSLPDIPGNPSDPDSGFISDLIGGIAGALVTEIGVGISLYTLAQDLIAMFDIKLHLQGVLFNNAATDLSEIYFHFGPNGQPNILPLSTTLPPAKAIMNPIDKKNYDCVPFTFFGGIGFLSLEGFYITMKAQRQRSEEISVYCEYYAGYRGIAPGDHERHPPLEDVFYTRSVTGVMVENTANPNGIAMIVCE
ncbi:hypothetical protein [Pseudomonas sp. CGJS7]|uniref:hypothetical protein n=1 Tax=Pseudomonas sp. CGJS7 TaxID=3109348 RepID=UPI00300AF8C1